MRSVYFSSMLSVVYYACPVEIISHSSYRLFLSFLTIVLAESNSKENYFCLWSAHVPSFGNWLQLFMLLQRISSCGWFAYVLLEGDPANRKYYLSLYYRLWAKRDAPSAECYSSLYPASCSFRHAFFPC